MFLLLLLLGLCCRLQCSVFSLVLGGEKLKRGRVRSGVESQVIGTGSSRAQVREKKKW